MEKNKSPRMKRKLINCNPSICCQDTLMTSDGIFVDWDVYKYNCLDECEMKNTCAYILTLLDKKKLEEAIETIKNSKLGKKS